MADNYEREMFLSAVAGMAGNVAPDLLNENQVARLLNCSSRGGHVHTRPRFVEYPVGVDSGVYQGAATYRLQDADRIVYCLSGTVFVLNLETGITRPVASFPTKTFDRAYFCQADKYFVIQNGIYDPVENWPIILDKETVVDNLAIRYYDPGTTPTIGATGAAGFYTISQAAQPERLRIPIGTAMAYGQGRLFVAVDRFKTALTSGYVSGLGTRFIIAGDVLEADNSEGVLAFSEYAGLGASGSLQVISLNWEIGLITAMGFFRNSYTGTGLGPLIVLAREGSSAFAVDLARTDWVDGGEFSKTLFYGSGSDSPWAFIAVNDDLVYRGRDGLRSIKYTQTREANSSGSLSNVPYSSEVDVFFGRDTREFLPFVSVAYADNRIITVSGGSSLGENFGTGFDTLVSLDTSVLNSISSSLPTRGYDGAWSGPQMFGVVSARWQDRDRIFVFCKSRTSPKIFLTYLDDTAVADFDGGRPVCRMYSKEYNFGNWVAAKEFRYVDAWFSEIEGDLEVTAYWRTDSGSVWRPCRVRSTSICSGSLGATMPQLRLIPDETYKDMCDTITGLKILLGHAIQFCIQWTGKAKLNRAVFAAKPITDRVGEDACGDSSTCVSLVATDHGLVLNDFTVYQV